MIMKKIIFSALLSAGLLANAQIVEIPDVNLKNVLVGKEELNTNGDGEIQLSEANAYSEVLHLPAGNISNLTGLETLVNMEGLVINPNPSITQLNLASNTGLHFLACFGTGITSLDISDLDLVTVSLVDNPYLAALNVENSSMDYLSAQSNALSYAVFSGANIGTLSLNNNEFEELDFGLTQIDQLNISNNPFLGYVNLKNGFEENFISLEELPNLELVCIENTGGELEAEYMELFPEWTAFTSDCGVEPNVYLGHVRFDLDGDGCDDTDLPLENIIVQSSKGLISKALGTAEDGSFSMDLYSLDGEYSTKLIGLPDHFLVNPGTVTSSFSGYGNTEQLNFCVDAEESHNIIELSLVSMAAPRPGFDSHYQLIYKNVGTGVGHGNLGLSFDATKMGFTEASADMTLEGSDFLSIEFANLSILETRVIDIFFNVYATTPLGETLELYAAASQNIADEETCYDEHEIHEEVIGSYDPNDVTVMEGELITVDDLDDYLHYRIRFQNTGTAEAINVRVENTLDEDLDWSTFQLLSTSHSSRFEIANGNEIDFIFDNIYLADETTDEPNSHGFITYKIKLAEEATIGTLIENQAAIFFDFNEPVITNIASTFVGQSVSTVGLDENGSLDYTVYPVPASDILHVDAKTAIAKIEISNEIGQLLLVKEGVNRLDVSSLSRGLYFVKVIDANGNFGIRKVIKQ